MTPQHQPVGFASATPGLQQKPGGGVPLGSETTRRGRVSLPNFATQGGGLGGIRSPDIGAVRSNMGPPAFIPSRDTSNPNNGSSWANANGIFAFLLTLLQNSPLENSLLIRILNIVEATPMRRPHLQGQTLTNSLHGRSENHQQRPTLGLLSQGNLNTIANSNLYGPGLQRQENIAQGGFLPNPIGSSARPYGNGNEWRSSGEMARGYSAETGIPLD